MRLNIKVLIGIIFLAGNIAYSDCALDHLVIGRNRDGVFGTADDNKLFLDCEDKYRNSGSELYVNWYYTLGESIYPEYPYRIGEPGFDTFQGSEPEHAHTFDPNRALAGAPDVDYSIIIECFEMSQGFQFVHKDYPQFTLAQPGDWFNHSQLANLYGGEGHVHLSYQADSGRELKWVTFLVYDSIEDGNQYAPAEPVTVVFNRQPQAGDLRVDGFIGPLDLVEFSFYWLCGQGSHRNDFYERADANRDGIVDILDFSLLANNWRYIDEPNEP